MGVEQQNGEGKKLSCRAAVAWAPNQPLSIETVEVAPPQPGEVRIRIHYTAICHTELFGLEGHDPTVQFPFIPGHEGAGIVESVGPGVTSVVAGDHVIPSPVAQCRKCANCLNPATNICDHFVFGTIFSQVMDDEKSRFTCKGKPVFHYIGLSTFSEYTVVREIAVCKISPKAPLDLVCLIGCGVTTGYGAPFNSCVVNAGSTAAVWGLGAIGLAAMLGCKARGAKHLVAVDINPERLKLASKFGATDFVNPNELPEGKTMVQFMREKYSGGVDFAFEATGNPTAMSQAVECIKRGVGQACILGVSDKSFQVSGEILFGRTIRGCCVGGCKPRDKMPQLVEQFMAGELMLEEFVSWRYPLEEINKGIQHLVNSEGIRTVIKMTAD